MSSKRLKHSSHEAEFATITADAGLGQVVTPSTWVLIYICMYVAFGERNGMNKPKVAFGHVAKDGSRTGLARFDKTTGFVHERYLVLNARFRAKEGAIALVGTINNLEYLTLATPNLAGNDAYGTTNWRWFRWCYLGCYGGCWPD